MTSSWCGGRIACGILVLVTPMTEATAHHEAGHAVACEHVGLPWALRLPIDDDTEDVLAAVQPQTPSAPIPDFTLEDAGLIAVSGWTAECQYLDRWDDPYVEEQSSRDLEMFEAWVSEKRQDEVKARARKLIEDEWPRVEQIARQFIAEHGEAR